MPLVAERLGRLAVTGLTIAAAVIVAVGLWVGDDRTDDRAQALASRLRCPVCESESVADSPAETARQMRALIEEQIADGWTDRQIIDFFVASYGERVLLDPPARGRNLLLWSLPVVGLIVGLAAIASRKRRVPAAAPGSEERAAGAEPSPPP